MNVNAKIRYVIVYRERGESWMPWPVLFDTQEEASERVVPLSVLLRPHNVKHDPEETEDVGMKCICCGSLKTQKAHEESWYCDDCEEHFIPADGVSDRADGLVVPRYVYRLAPTSTDTCHKYEIGQCDNPRSYSGWCDRRVCEGFWGDEQLCASTVDAMNRHNDLNEPRGK